MLLGDVYIDLIYYGKFKNIFIYYLISRLKILLNCYKGVIYLQIYYMTHKKIIILLLLKVTKYFSVISNNLER